MVYSVVDLYFYISSDSTDPHPCCTHNYSAQKKLAKELWDAVAYRDIIKVTSLLGQGADPNHHLYWSEERKREPPLHRACSKGYLEIVKTLVTHRAHTDKGGGKDSITPLHYACWGGHLKIVDYLIREVGCSTGKYNVVFIIICVHYCSSISESIISTIIFSV